MARMVRMARTVGTVGTAETAPKLNMADDVAAKDPAVGTSRNTALQATMRTTICIATGGRNTLQMQI